MKITTRFCDICDKEINRIDAICFYKYRFSLFYIPVRAGIKNKVDVCWDCQRKIDKYIKEKLKEDKNEDKV